MTTYEEKRAEVERIFEKSTVIDDLKEEHLSPSGKYKLTIQVYQTGERSWNYSRGIVREVNNNQIVADVKRNFSNFWHVWCLHANGNEYLLCGEDYQGQTVINLSKRTTTNYFPESGLAGWGFCWVDAHPSLDSSLLAVEGCYWGVPYEVVIFDFTNPDKLPLKELHRDHEPCKILGWSADNKFTYLTEIEIRQSDGASYDSLSAEEQDALDSGEVESGIIQTEIIIDARRFLTNN